MGSGDFSSDFGSFPPPGRSFGPDDVGPAKKSRGIDLSVENPFLTIWTRPRATIRAIVDTDPNRHVLLLAAIGGVVNALDRATWKNAETRCHCPQFSRSASC
jgi:hypothetical protein